MKIYFGILENYEKFTGGSQLKWAIRIKFDSYLMLGLSERALLFVAREWELLNKPKSLND